MGYRVHYNGEVSVTPPLTEDDTAALHAFVDLERTEEAAPIFAAIAASSEPDLPGYAGLLDVSEERDLLLPEGGESRHGLRMWLKLSLQHFLIPRGYVLNGEVRWEGEDADDRGCIFVKNNKLEDVEDVILHPGPSWSPERFADLQLKRMIQQLIESADSTGCTPDLAVVAAEPLEALRSALPRLDEFASAHLT